VRLVQSAQQSFLKTMTFRLFKVGKREKNILSCAVEKTHVKNKILPCVFFLCRGSYKKMHDKDGLCRAAERRRTTKVGFAIVVLLLVLMGVEHGY
jgi:hypothetical protein